MHVPCTVFLSVYVRAGAAIVVEVQRSSPVFSELIYNPQCFLINHDPTLQPAEWEDVSLKLHYSICHIHSLATPTHPQAGHPGGERAKSLLHFFILHRIAQKSIPIICCCCCGYLLTNKNALGHSKSIEIQHHNLRNLFFSSACFVSTSTSMNNDLSVGV